MTPMTSPSSVAPAWRKLSARMRRHVQHTASRGDLIARIGPLGLSAPAACYVPALAEVRFNADKLLTAGSDPARIDPDNPQDRRRHPALMGAAYHEAAHAAHTRLIPRLGDDPRVVEVALLLEEPRIEAKLIDTSIRYRPFLRASAQVVIKLDGADPADLGNLRALVLIDGRRTAGVLTSTETQPVIEACRAAWGDERLNAAVELIAEAVLVDDEDSAELMRLAAELLALVSPDDPDDPAVGEEGDGEESPGQGGSSSGAGQDDTEATDQQPGDGAETEDGTGDAAQSGRDDAQPRDAPAQNSAAGTAHQMPCGSWTPGDLPGPAAPWTQPPPRQQPPTPADEAARKTIDHVADDAREQLQPQPVAKPRTTDRDRQERQLVAADTQHVAGSGRGSLVQTFTYEPSSHLLSETRRLTSVLRAAAYRGSDITRVAQMAPPGQLRTGELMRRDGQIAMGLRPTAEPWRRKMRHDREQPRLTVGIIGDVSSSMNSYQRGTAALTYALSHAIGTLNGTVAAVAFHDDVALTLPARYRRRRVTEAVCEHGTSRLPMALRAIDGHLKLTTETQPVRVVVIVSDGAVSNPRECRTEIERLVRHGVKVLLVSDSANHDLGDVTTLVLPPPIPAPATKKGASAGAEVVFAQQLGDALAALLREA